MREEEPLKGRVLIIDDEAEIRRNLTVGLTQEGYRAVACPDGISAIHELHRAAQEGSGYEYLVTDIFMPDIDGLKILKVIKNQYPKLPVLVITGFGDEGTRFTALSEYNTGYLDKPFEISDLVDALEELSPGTTIDQEKAGIAETAEEGLKESFSAYLTIRIDDAARSMEIFDELYNMDGVQSCDAVRGDVDIILLIQASSPEGINAVSDRVKAVAGLKIVSDSPVERPKLDRDVDEFIDIYRKIVKEKAKKGSGVHSGTTSYIIVDIEKGAIQQIFTTVFFIDEVIFCDVIEDGTKLVGMITGQEAVGRAPRIIDKLSRIEGVRRIREAKIIKLRED
jgi:CheY-like chemotaxis protein